MQTCSYIRKTSNMLIYSKNIKCNKMLIGQSNKQQSIHLIYKLLKKYSNQQIIILPTYRMINQRLVNNTNLMLPESFPALSFQGQDLSFSSIIHHSSFHQKLLRQSHLDPDDALPETGGFPYGRSRHQGQFATLNRRMACSTVSRMFSRAFSGSMASSSVWILRRIGKKASMPF